MSISPQSETRDTKPQPRHLSREILAYNRGTSTQTERTVIKPMLAHTLKRDKMRNLPDSIYVQPKLDGIRLIATREGYFSRNGNPLPIPEKIMSSIQKAFAERIPDNVLALDGELYIHGVTFQQIASIVKNVNNPTRHLLEYHVYDCIPESFYEAKFRHRNDLVSNHLRKLPFITPVRTTLTNPDGIEHYLNSFVLNGYEGIIVRDPNSLYEQKRSHGLLKLKNFEEDDFKIASITSGQGKNTDAAMLELKTKEGRSFWVTAPGNYEEKTHPLRHPKEFLGKKMSVKYQNLTDDGIPRFPIALGVKEDR